MAKEQSLREAHDAKDVGKILLLLRAARGRRHGEPGAFVDQRLNVLERHLGAGRKAVPERILRLVGARQVLAIILIDHAQIEAEVVGARRADDEAAVEEGAIIGAAAVRLLELLFDQLRADEPAIGGTMQDGATRL